MLLPAGDLDGFIHLPLHAQSSKGGKGSILIRAVIPHRVKQTDHSLLDQVLLLPAYKKHGMGFFQHHAFVFIDQVIRQLPLPGSLPLDQLLVCIVFILFHIFYPRYCLLFSVFRQLICFVLTAPAYWKFLCLTIS